MAIPILDQKDIPTIAALYEKDEIVPVAEEPLFAPSAELNAKVGLIRHDITKLRLPEGAIVNAANNSLLGGGGVDGAIHRAAGDHLYRECKTLDGCRTGDAKMTDAYNIPCKKIIHAVGPVYRSVDNPEDVLASCYETSLTLAVKAGLKVVAFSALSTGVYGYPSMEAADVVLETVRLFLETSEGKKLDLVVFCNFEKKDMVAYHHMVPVYFPRVEEATDAPETSPAYINKSGEKAIDNAETSTADNVDEAPADKPESDSTAKVETSVAETGKPETEKTEKEKIEAIQISEGRRR